MKRLLEFTCLMLAIVSCDKRTEQATLPNIVLFYCDDLGWMDVGYQGNTYYETPGIDQFAEEGMVFTSAYANGPFCSPSRASLMTGLYTPRHQVYIPGAIERGQASDRRYLAPENLHDLDTAFVTLAEVLKMKGYCNAHIGKWHLGGNEYKPEYQGFDLNVGGNRSGKIQSFFSPYHNADILETAEGEYLTDRLTDEAIDFISGNKDRPFFLFLSHYAPHTPIEGKPEKVKKYRDKKNNNPRYEAEYGAMIESLDESFSRIMRVLEEYALADHTIVIFYSDNGGYALATSNKPLRGSKGTIYEGGIRVPLIIHWPGMALESGECDIPVIGSDLFPTMLDMLGMDPALYPSDGTSLLPIFEDAASTLAERPLFWYVPVYLDSYDYARYERDGILHKMELTAGGQIRQDSSIESHPAEGPPAWRCTPVNAVRKGDFKLIEFFEKDELELYDVVADIDENDNLASEMPEKVKELYAIMDSIRKATGAPFPLESNPEYEDGRSH